MRVKLKLQWRLQEVRDVRNVDYQPRKAAGSKQRQPKAEVMWDKTSKVTGVGLPTPFGAQFTSWYALDFTYGAMFVLLGFSFTLVLFFLCIFLFYSFGIRMFTLSHHARIM